MKARLTNDISGMATIRNSRIVAREMQAYLKAYLFDGHFTVPQKVARITDRPAETPFWIELASKPSTGGRKK